ncbi:MAG: DUF2341 domain-containing protein [Candidatus Woesearchaeota archaeon]
MKNKYKKEVLCITKFSLLVLLIMFFSLIFMSVVNSSQKSDFELVIDTDKNYYYANEKIKISAKGYFDDILVISIPLKIFVIDPTGNEFELELKHDSGGVYSSDFIPKTTGTYKIKGVVDINGDIYEKLIEIVVIGQKLDLKLNLPNVLDYVYGPVDVHGSVSILEEGKELTKRVDLLIMSQNNPVYEYLCSFQCVGKCDFNCTMSKNLELSDYYVIAKIIHDGTEHISQDSFSLQLPSTENLIADILHNNSYYLHDTANILIEPIYEDSKLDSGVINLEIIYPDNSTETIFLNEFSKGKYSADLDLNLVGNYSLKATIIKDNLFKIINSSFIVTKQKEILTPKFTKKAFDLTDNYFYTLSLFNLSKDFEFLDLSEFISKDTNFSEIYIVFDNQRHKININNVLFNLKEFFISNNFTNYNKNNSYIIFESKTIKNNLSIDGLDKNLEKKLYESNFVNNYYNLDVFENKLDKLEYDFVRLNLTLDNNHISFVLENNTKLNPYWYFLNDLNVNYLESNVSNFNNYILYTNSKHNKIYLNNKELLKNKKFSLNLDEFILQSESILIKPEILTKNLDKNLSKNYTYYLEIYSPDNSLILKEHFSNFYIYQTTNKTKIGNYFITVVVKDEYDNIVASLKSTINVLSTTPKVSIKNEYYKKLQRNSYYDFVHIVKNENYKNFDIIDLVYESNFTNVEFFYENKTKLKDTTRSSNVNTRKLKPGEELKIIARAYVPLDASIGLIDNIKIHSISNAGVSNDSIVNEIEVVAFIDEDKKEFIDDLEIISIEEKSNHFLIYVKNHYNNTKSANLNIKINDLNNESKDYEILLKRPINKDSIESFVLLKPFIFNSGFIVNASLKNEENNLLNDVNKDNNQRIYVFNDDWLIKDLKFRKIIPFRDTLYTDYESYILRVFVDLGDNLKDSIIPVFFNGTDYELLNYEFLSFDDLTNSGILLIELKNIKKGFISDLYLYFDNFKSTFDYENKKINFEKILTNNDAKTVGRWISDTQVKGYYGRDYLHDLNLDKGFKSITYKPNLELNNYEIYINYPAHDSFSENTPLIFNHNSGTDYFEINQKINGDNWNYLGLYTLGENSSITLGNFGTREIVVSDSFKFRKISHYANVLHLQKYVNKSIYYVDDDKLILKKDFIDDDFLFDDLLIEEELNVSINDSLFNETTTNQTTINETTINETTINETTTNETTINETTINETRTNETTINETRTNKTSINETRINETRINETKINETRTNETRINDTTINETIDHNLSKIDYEKIIDKKDAKIKQRAVVGEPVSWNVEIDLKNSKLDDLIIPIEAKNLTLFKKDKLIEAFNLTIDDKIISNIDLEKISTLNELIKELENIKKEREKSNLIKKATLYFTQRNVNSKLTDLKDELRNVDDFLNETNNLKNITNKKIILPREELINAQEKINISFITDSPKINVTTEKIKDFKLKKDIKVYSNASIHYENVLTTINITKSKPNQIKLFHLVDGEKINIIDDERFNVTLIDLDNDTYIDQISFNVLKLSEQNFELEIDLAILNVQSYPSIHNNWTVYFNTTGTNDLIITVINDTTWTEFLLDDKNTKDDMIFKSLKCGDNELKEDELYAILEDNTQIQYLDLSSIDSYKVKSLLYKDWNCDDTTASLSNEIITTGKHHLKFEFGDEVGFANNMGFLLYEYFESYSNNTKANYFVDYTSGGVNADVFSVFNNGTDKFYRANITGTYISEYNLTQAFSWDNYEILLKTRIVEDLGTEEIGILFYSDFLSSRYYRIRSNAGGNFVLTGHGGLVGGTLDSGISPSLNTWYYMRINVQTAGTNTDIKAKIWDESSNEPTSWQIDSNTILDTPLYNGSVAFYARDAVVDYDFIVVENISYTPIITIDSPVTSPSYNISENIWFNVSLDKLAKNCNYTINNTTYNMTKINDTSFYANQSFSDYGVKNVFFECEDYHDNVVNASRNFGIGVGAITILSPEAGVTTNYNPQLDAVFNQTYDSWYNINNGVNSSVVNTDNLIANLGPLLNGDYTVYVFVNNSGSIISNQVSFKVTVPDPNPLFYIGPGNATYTSTNTADLYIGGDYIANYSLSCDNNSWSSWYTHPGDGSTYIHLDFDLTNGALGCSLGEGLKTVYINVSNGVEVYEDAVDTIIYDSSKFSGETFTEYFVNDSFTQSHENISFNIGTFGGIRLDAGCLNYPFESGCWNYRNHVVLEEISENDYSNGTQYGFSINTPDLVSEGKLKSDCSDIRVVYYNKTSETLQRVYHWFDSEACSEYNSEIWINLSIQPNDIQEYYIYYGNPSADFDSTYYDGEEVFEFFDDFSIAPGNDGRWSVVGTSFGAESGILHLQRTGNSRSWAYPSVPFNFSDHIAEFRYKVDWGDEEGGILYRTSGGADGTLEGHELGTRGRNEHDHVYWRMTGLLTGGGGHGSAQRANLGWPVYQDEWYYARLIAQSNSFNWFPDLYENSWSEFSFSNSAHSWGNIGFWQYRRSDFKVDFIFVRKLPATSLSATYEEQANYEPSGFTYSELIKPAAFKNWEYILFDHKIPDDTYINYYVYDNSSNLLCSFEGIKDVQIYDISSCAHGYNQIQIYVDFKTYNEFYSPTLDLYTVKWNSISDIFLDEPRELYHEWFTPFFSNATFVNDLNSCDVNSYLQYRISSQVNEFIENSYDYFIDNEDVTDIKIQDYLRLEADESVGNLIDSGWDNRYSFNVSLDEARTDYPIKFELDSTDIDFTKTDFTDIRVTYYNDVSGVEELINHWVEFSDDTSVIIWAKIPSLSTTQTTVHIYYGNVGVEDLSDGNDVFEFFDDFTGSSIDTSKWDIVDSTGFSVSNNELVGTSTTGRIQSIETFSEPLIYESKMRTSIRASAGQMTAGFWTSTASGVGVRENSGGSPSRYWTRVGGGWVGPTTFDTLIGTHKIILNSNSGNVDVTIDDFETGNSRTDTRAFTISNHPITLGRRYDDNNLGQNYDTRWDWIFVRPRESIETITKLGTTTKYKPYGTYTSKIFDTTYSTVGFGNIFYSGTLSEMQIYTRTSNDGVYFSDWQLQENGKQITSPNRRYIQYLVEMNSSIKTYTPKLNEIKIEYSRSSPNFITIDNLNPAISTGTNPYLCGILSSGQSCNPVWDNVEPKVRGMYNLRVLANSTNCDHYEKISNMKTFYVFANTEIIDFNSNVNSAVHGDTIIFTGRVVDELSSPVVNRKVYLFLDGDELEEVNTNSNGYFTIDYVVDDDLDIGNNNFEVRFKKDYEAFYNSSNAFKEIKISSLPEITSITTTPYPAGNFEPVTINASVIDLVGGINVYVKVRKPNGVTTNHLMNDLGDGNYTFTFTDTWNIGNYDITINATNSDGISNFRSSNFLISIQGNANSDLNKDEFRNYEDVFLNINDYWRYKKEINFSVGLGIVPSDYQVHLLLTSGIVGSNFAWDQECNDLRFVDENGIELNYWVEFCDASEREASVWIKTDNPTSSDYNVYMYYDNSFAASKSNAEDTFILFGDFSGNSLPDGWTWTDVNSVGDVTVNNGEVNIYSSFAADVWQNDYEATLVWQDELVTGDFEAIARLTDYTSVDAWAKTGIITQGTNAAQANDGKAMIVQTISNGLSLQWQTGGFVAPSSSSTGGNLDLPRYLRMVRYGDSISGYYSDDAETWTQRGSDETPVGISPSQYINLVHTSHRNDDNVRNAVFDLFYVKKYSAVEPTFTFGTEEELPNDEKKIGYKSGFVNLGTTPIKGYRLGIVQKYDGTSWVNVLPAVINDRIFLDLKTINPGDNLDIEDEWNLMPFNTDDYEPGLYRTKIALVNNATNPTASSSVIVDNTGRRIENFNEFIIKESRLFLNEIMYPNYHEYGLIEYETTDTIDWVNISLLAKDNTALDVDVNLTLLDRFDAGYAGFGPNEELKNYGDILVDTTKTRTWDNETFGYYIGEDLVTNTYELNWKVNWDTVSEGEETEDNLIIFETEQDWSFATNSENISIFRDEFELDTNTIVTRDDSGASSSGFGGWQTYYEETVDVSRMDDMHMAFRYTLTPDGDAEARVRAYVDSTQVHYDDGSGTNEWNNIIDVNDTNSVTVRFEYYSETIDGGFWSPDDVSSVSIDWAEHEYFYFSNEGFLETSTKGMIESMPNLVDLSYQLNGEKIKLDVIGSPGTVDEEKITVNLDGLTQYDLVWNEWHEDFKINITLNTSNLSRSPVVNSLTLKSLDHVNVRKYIKVHNIPSTFNTSALERLYLNEYTPIDFSFINLWTEKNLTDVSVTLNCPNLPGLDCLCIGEVDNVCNFNYLEPLTKLESYFNITADDATPTGDYYINFTINYTNPVGNNKSWKQKKGQLLEIRERGLLEIFVDYYEDVVTRGEFTTINLYANNTNTSTPDTNAWLNYTAVPNSWNVNSGNLNQFKTALDPGEYIWNNITFDIGLNANLGSQKIMANSSADSAIPDFKQAFIDVYANTFITEFYPTELNVSRGENVDLIARLTWDNGSIISGERIYFYDEIENSLVGSALTNSTGYAKVNYNIDSSAILGLHNLNATYLGKASIFTNPSNKSTILDVGLKPLIMNLSNYPSIIGYGNNITINANLTDDQGIDTALFFVTYPNGLIKNFSMHDVTIHDEVTWSEESDWLNAVDTEYIDINNDQITLLGNEIKTYRYDYPNTHSGGDGWRTYYEKTIDVSSINEMRVSYNYELDHNGAPNAGVRVLLDGTEIHFDETAGSNTWTGFEDVSLEDEITLSFQYRSQTGGLWTTVTSSATINWAEHYYLHLEDEGHLETDIKTMTQSMPDLTNLKYDLNSGEIELEIIGSPGTASQETIIKELTGHNYYDLDWNNYHEDFKTIINFKSLDGVNSPIFDSLTLKKTKQDFEYVFDDTWFNGTYDYYIWANDTSGSTVQSSIKSFDVELDKGIIEFKTINSTYEQFEDVLIQNNLIGRYKQNIFLNSSTGNVPVHYQVHLFLNESNVGKNFAPEQECNDLRFIDEDGNELNYWVNYCNETLKEASVWIKTEKEITTSGYNIYMYYDNPALESQSNHSNVFLKDQIFLMTLRCPENDADCDPLASHNTALFMRENMGLDPYTLDGQGYVTTINHDTNTYGFDDYYYSRYRFLFIPETSGTYWFGTNSDDGSEVTIFPMDGYGGGIRTTQPFGNHDVVADWYGNHGAGTCGTSGNQYSRELEAGKGYFFDYIHHERGGGQLAQMCINTGSGYDIVSIANFPNQIYARNYITPEPTINFREEEASSFSRDINAHVMMNVQRFSSGIFEDVNLHVDDLSTSTFRSTQNGFLNISNVWNPNPWNTENNPEGLYRINTYLVSPYGDILNSTDGKIEGFANFTITPPPVNATIENIRIFEIDYDLKHDPGVLEDEGLNKTFSLFLDKTYRVEISVKNQLNSNPWNISLVNTNHSILNESWIVNESEDIWYRVHTGSNNFNNYFNNNTVSWNTTPYTTLVQPNRAVTFYYVLNITPDESKGNYPVEFILEDPYFTRQDNSVFKIIPETLDAPKLYNETYNITNTDVIRVFNSTTIYGRWNQEISEALVYYNATSSSIVSTSISLPIDNPQNWTNHTFNPTAGWLRGVHVAQIRAKNPSDVWNETLEFIKFNIFGLAYIKDFNLNTTDVGIGNTVNINCSVFDNTNNLRIENYNISIYSSVEGLLYNNFTNSNGFIHYNFTPSSFGVHEISCVIEDDLDNFYKTDDRRVQAQEIFILEFEPPKYFDVSGNFMVFKNDFFNTSSRWTDNAELNYAYLQMNYTGSFENVTNMSLTGVEDWANFSYQIPINIIPGIYSWYHLTSDSSLNYNQTPKLNVEIWGKSKISEMLQEPPGIQPTNYTTTTCRILDINSNNPIENYNVSFWINDNYLGSNITNSTGYSSFKFNYSTLGSHTIKCNITDEDDMYYKASLSDELTDNLNVVASPDVYSPKLLSYGINESEIMRNQCVLVYGQWDEEINYSKVIYNMSDTFTQKHIEPPYIGNWSNITLCTNNSWHVGVKELKLWANDTVGNINKSVSYLNFTLNGRSAIEWISPIATATRDEIDLVCRVYDFDNNHNISGYNVVFLDDDGALIGNNQTMDDGKAIMKYDATFLDTGDYTFRCQIQTAPTLYYPTRSVSFAEQTLTFATINTSLNIFDTTDFETKYQNENVTFYANFTDNNGLAKDGICNITIYDYNYNHTNNMIFNNVTDYYEYNYSFNYSGMYDWNVTCNSLDSEAITKNSTAIIYDNLAPIINLITPINNAIIDYQDTIVFYYNVTDESGVENCSLFINGELNQTNDTILMDTTLNFSIDNLMPSNYNWSILCYDQSSLNNQANSEIRNLTIGGAKVIFDIINYPNYVFRNDNSVEFTINVTNNGTLNATDTNITFKIPNDWQFSVGNTTDQIVTIDINESVLVSWHVDIPNFASFGEKQINFSSNLSIAGVDDYLSLFVNVSTIDLSIDEIISPLNNSCTYDNLFILANITNNDNISKDNVNITLLINGTYKDSKIENFTNYESGLINFTNVFVNESYYNITLLVDEINDINFDDNVMSIFVNRYYKDLTYNFTSSSISDNVYNQSYTIINNKDCDLEFGSLYGFIDNDFVFDYSVPLSNSSYGVIGSYNGDIYQWDNTIPALSFVNGYYIVNGINNYHANLLYITGITVG